MFDLNGKRALVTGASGGIGGAIARALHARGATVGLSGTRVEALRALAAELKDRAHELPADLSDPAAAEQLVKAADEKLGGVDILINNAGLTRDGLAVRMKDEDWQKVLDVNLSAAFRLCRASLRGMMKRRWGRIVSISSIIGAIGNAGQANYAASKAGVMALTRSLARELGPSGVTVNCVAPGMVRTAMSADLPAKVLEDAVAETALGRLADPEDVAHAVAFLCSSRARHITGTVIQVDGGQRM